MNVTELINATLPDTSVGVTVPHYGLQFGEDGVRQPPSYTESNNVIIMVLGLGLLIVPVAGFLVCMCAKSRVLRTLRGMKFTSDPDSGDGSGLPYSRKCCELCGENWDNTSIHPYLQNSTLKLKISNRTRESRRRGKLSSFLTPRIRMSEYLSIMITHLREVRPKKWAIRMLY